jgi:spoIIIJ-associated protein
MPSWLEFEDKSVEKAVSKACAELNIKKEKLKHDVISYGSSGIFGLVGTKKARIRVEVPDAEKDTPPKAVAPQAERGVENDAPPKAAAPQAERGAENDAPPKAAAPQAERGAENDAPPKAAAPQAERSAENDVEEETTLPLPVAESTPLSEIIENSIDIGRAVLERIVDGITTGASISVEEKPDRILFDIQGGTAGVLIGKRGQNLEAIHYLVEKVVNKNAGSRVRIQVDVEGYLETRRNSLKRLAERLAQKSKKTGKPMTIGQMNAHDRRIIHLALKEDHGVRTQSMGDGYYRKLVIFPKKHASQRHK